MSELKIEMSELKIEMSELKTEMSELKKKVADLSYTGSWCAYQNEWTYHGPITYENILTADSNMNGNALNTRNGEIQYKQALQQVLGSCSAYKAYKSM